MNCWAFWLAYFCFFSWKFHTVLKCKNCVTLTILSLISKYFTDALIKPIQNFPRGRCPGYKRTALAHLSFVSRYSLSGCTLCYSFTFISLFFCVFSFMVLFHCFKKACLSRWSSWMKCRHRHVLLVGAAYI